MVHYVYRIVDFLAKEICFILTGDKVLYDCTTLRDGSYLRFSVPYHDCEALVLCLVLVVYIICNTMDGFK
jgi:hypothetical protein